MAAASPISPFGAAACSCHGSSGSVVPKEEAVPADRNCPVHPAAADLGTGSPSNLLSQQPESALSLGVACPWHIMFSLSTWLSWVEVRGTGIFFEPRLRTSPGT